MEHREGGGVQGEAKTVDTMTILRGGAHSGVYDGELEADTQGGDSD